MGVKITSYNLSQLSSDPFLRMDFDYLEISEELNITRDVPRLKKFITKLDTGQPITKEDYHLEGKSDYIHIVVRNIKEGELDLSDPIYIKDDKGEELKKHALKKGDIVVAISASCGASFIYEDLGENVQLTLSHYLAKLNVDTNGINPNLLVNYFNSAIMQKYFRSAETGKTQKNLSKYYIRELPLLIPEDRTKQDDLAKRIKPIEEEIKTIKRKIRSESDIINGVFVKKFTWDYEIFRQLKEIKTINPSFSIFSNNIDLRFSYKFHNKAGEYVTKVLHEMTAKKIKHYLAEEITLGKSISPTDYDENGEQYYLSMADIKSWYFNTIEAKTTTEDYFTANPKKQVAVNDIILARSGEGTIGKVALITNSEKQAVYADFTMRIRLKEYNVKFAYYYFRTDFFQYLIYTHKKGLGNNTNIFPSQVQEFPIPDISEKEQLLIVEEIDKAIMEQKRYEDEIHQKKLLISNLIEEALTLNEISNE